MAADGEKQMAVDTGSGSEAQRALTVAYPRRLRECRSERRSRSLLRLDSLAS